MCRKEVKTRGYTQLLCYYTSYNTGTKQSGETLENIILPPWSKGDPHEFIRVHREVYTV